MRLKSRLLILLLVVVSMSFLAPSTRAQITFPEEPKGERLRQPQGELGWRQVESGSTQVLAILRQAGSRTLFAGAHVNRIRSADLGLTWNSWPTPGITDVFFFDSLLGVGSRFGPPPNLYLTSDGGKRWDTLTSEASGGEGGRPGRLHFPSRDTGYACGLNAVMRTTNGGKIWYVRDVQYFVNGLHGPNARTMFLVGDAYKHQQHPDSPATAGFFKTTNAGESWESMDIRLRPTLTCVVARSSRHVIVGSSGGMLACSFDGGESWVDTVVYPNSGRVISGLCFIDDSIGYACGSEGMIFRTDDGGQTWRGQPTPTANRLYSIVFLDHSIGIAVGDNGTILRTTNAGLAWVQVAPTPLPLINRIVLSESGTTSLRYELPSTEKVTLTIYSLTGAVVTVLKDHLLEHQGWHEVDLSSQL